ncbi:hypothetical protein Goklo_022799 [Gossypium klotzschianum]|uniref:Nuclear speckle splicing regulatory protein 1 N-terminal domain-containing protein n=1 Tax=Gossypium klotzschianum TaxID=34286 RepID=A0A7J8TNI0_9ROSI|nr:hypothetical protein [Gossypium klotzschianum]
MKKYGLQLRVPPSQQKKPVTRPPLPPPRGFQEDDDDDVEKEISRQASKNKALKEVEEQHKKALEEDPSVFDYDGVYDAMKEEVVRPRAQDREERKQPKYIHNLMKKAEQRKWEQEIVYERKLVKERSKEDHLYADKDKFVTSAYKRKLAEQAKWMEEERLRQLREEKEDVTKKSDLSDFYFNLGKNVAFGANEAKPRKPELREPEKEKEKEVLNRVNPLPDSISPESSAVIDRTRDESSSREIFDSRDSKPITEDTVPDTAVQETTSEKQPSVDQPKSDHHKRGADAVAAARERFLARKRAKEQ